MKVPKISKDIRTAAKWAKKNGFRIEATKNNHIRFVHSDRRVKIVITSSTPSCSRAGKNTLAELKRALRGMEAV